VTSEEAGVLHHDGGGPCAFVGRIGNGAIGASTIRQAGACQATPDGVAVDAGVGSQLLRMVERKGDGTREVLADGVGMEAVDEAECLVSTSGQGERIGEAVVDGGHRGKDAPSAQNATRPEGSLRK
jgi:hypothetical protein